MAATIKLKKIYIEISNICNLQCTFCPIVEREKDIMSEEAFRKILSRSAKLAEEICLHVMGEPLGHPEFAHFIKIAEEIGTPIQITTNGTLLHGAAADALLSPIVRQVNFSLQSFVDNFPNSDPTTYWTKIFDFVRKAMDQRPDLYINFRLWNLKNTSGEDETNTKFFDFLEKYFSIEVTRGIELGLRKSKRLFGRVYLHFDSRFEWPSLKSEVRSTKGFCHALSSHAAILSNGAVIPCCLDKEAQLKLGNCLEQNLEAILNSTKANAIRDGFARGEAVESLCQRCDYIQRFSGKAKRLAANLKSS